MSSPLDALCRRVLDVGRFVIGAGGEHALQVSVSETTPWELYRGHLLGASQTRAAATLDRWTAVFRWPDGAGPEPLVSILWDQAGGQIFVTRGIELWGHETYDSGPNVIATRAARVWHSELVARLDCEEAALGDHRAPPLLARLEAELTSAVGLALRGTSRLPITSLETPLVAYALGRLTYDPAAEASGLARSACDWLDSLPVRLPKADNDTAALWLEWLLRMAPYETLPDRAKACGMAWIAAGRMRDELLAVLRKLFFQLALSSHSRVGENLAQLLTGWSDETLLGPQSMLEFVGFALRQLGRHLTAYDLVKFHNRGANYPDALFLESLLALFESLLEQGAEGRGDEMAHRLARRGWRHGCLLRRYYAGHRVPEFPTSPGENSRVMPGHSPRLDEEQFSLSGERPRRLFEAEATIESTTSEQREFPRTEAGRDLLKAWAAEMEQQAELLELGMATFLDRPLGVEKPPGELDRTPLVSYDAFSREIASDRLAEMRRWGWLDAARVHALRARLEAMSIVGVSVADFRGDARPGVVSLEDARLVSADFVFLRTTRSSLDGLLTRLDLRPLSARDPELARWLMTGRDVLFIRQPDGSEQGPRWIARDAAGRTRIEFHLSTPGRATYTLLGVKERPLAPLVARPVGPGRDESLTLSWRDDS